MSLLGCVNTLPALALASFASSAGVVAQHAKALATSNDARLKLSADQQSFDEAGSKSILQGKVVTKTYKLMAVKPLST
jgi:lipopolysaccharide export system protein LptA